MHKGQNDFKLMNQIFFNSRYEWKKGNILESYDILNDFLTEKAKQEVFSMPEDLFDKSYSNYLLFFNTLISNDCLRAAFCDIFPSIWENNPNNDLLTSLVIRDFSKPSLINSLGMEEFGFPDPEENFQKIISALRNTAQRGFLTTSNKKVTLSGRVHVDFSYLKEILLESNWPSFKDELWAFEKELDSINISWAQISRDDNNLILSSSLYELLGRFDSTEMKQNEITVTGCLQMDIEWKNALVNSIEVAMTETSEQELDRLVKASSQFNEMQVTGSEWLKRFLDYTIQFKKEAFYELY